MRRSALFLVSLAGSVLFAACAEAAEFYVDPAAAAAPDAGATGGYACTLGGRGSALGAWTLVGVAALLGFTRRRARGC